METIGPGLRYVTTPTEQWLSEALERCSRRFLAASPFVGRLFAELVGRIPGSIERVLVTRTDLRAFATGASSAETICGLAAGGVEVRNLPGLHAKVYVIDGEQALVTSANATAGGLRINREFGLLVENTTAVAAIAAQVASGFGAADPPKTVSAEDLAILREAAGGLRAALPSDGPARSAGSEVTEECELLVPNAAALLGKFRGWKRLVLRGILAQERDEFTLQDMYGTCERWARAEYPDNNTWEFTLRRVLQELRDYGLVDFLDRGRYRRTFRLEDPGQVEV